jgi:DNA-binding response OmpR family regulator
MRVLLIEDHEEMSAVIARGLRREGMAVDIAPDGEVGWFKVSIYDYDVVILDRDLPLLHGDDLCLKLREEGLTTRVLMLTATSGPEQVAQGLGMGADDYLTKPFDFLELIARVRALARRPEPTHSPILEAAGIRLDTGNRMVSRDGRRIRLARKETGVLEVLLSVDGRVVSAEELLERVWDEDVDPITTAVRTSIKKLRQRLGEPNPIETVINAGYRIAP